MIDDLERALIVATQGGLPLVARPAHQVAEQLGISAEEVMRRLQNLLDNGIIRRIGAVPNHYVIGWTANGMRVWDVEDSEIDRLGELVGGWLSSPIAIAVHVPCGIGLTTSSPWCMVLRARSARKRQGRFGWSWGTPAGPVTFSIRRVFFKKAACGSDVLARMSKETPRKVSLL